MAKFPVLLSVITVLFTLACSAGQIAIATSTPTGEPTVTLASAPPIATSTPTGEPTAALPSAPPIATLTPTGEPTIVHVSAAPTAILIEAEDYESVSPEGVRPDSRGRGQLSNGEAIHIGGDDEVPDDASGRAQYTFDVLKVTTVTTIEIRYADDVDGDTGTILLDGKKIASFSTADTGTWDDYITTSLPAASIQLQPGPHTLELEVTDNGTYGLTIDYLEIILP